MNIFDTSHLLSIGVMTNRMQDSATRERKQRFRYRNVARHGKWNVFVDVYRAKYAETLKTSDSTTEISSLEIHIMGWARMGNSSLTIKFFRTKRRSIEIYRVIGLRLTVSIKLWTVVRKRHILKAFILFDVRHNHDVNINGKGRLKVIRILKKTDLHPDDSCMLIASDEVHTEKMY